MEPSRIRHGETGLPQPGAPHFTDGHRNFYFEDKTYVGADGEKKTIRTQAVHDFIPTVNPNDLMGPRKPGGKVNYDVSLPLLLHSLLLSLLTRILGFHNL